MCLGDILMDMLPDKEGVEWNKISNFSPVPGGSVANVAVSLAKLGVRTNFIGKVGKDPFGQILADTLKKNGVDISTMMFDPKARTTLGFVSIGKKEDNDFVFYRNPGADMMLCPDEVDEISITKSRIFHFGSITITTDPSCSAALKAVSLAKEHHVLVSFDPNLRLSLWKNLDRAKKRILDIIQTVDLLKMNKEECEFLTGTKELAEGAKKLIQRGPKILVITRGEKGSSLFTLEKSCFFPSFRVEVVDTVGCGDSFTAALIYKMLSLTREDKDVSSLDKEQMEQILIFANAAGALTATGKGVVSSLPSKKKVDKFLETNISGGSR